MIDPLPLYPSPYQAPILAILYPLSFLISIDPEFLVLEPRKTTSPLALLKIRIDSEVIIILPLSSSIVIGLFVIWFDLPELLKKKIQTNTKNKCGEKACKILLHIYPFFI